MRVRKTGDMHRGERGEVEDAVAARIVARQPEGELALEAEKPGRHTELRSAGELRLAKQRPGHGLRAGKRLLHGEVGRADLVAARRPAERGDCTRLHGLGVETGIDLDALVRTSAWMAGQLGRPSPSRTLTALMPGLES